MVRKLDNSGLLDRWTGRPYSVCAVIRAMVTSLAGVLGAFLFAGLPLLSPVWSLDPEQAGSISVLLTLVTGGLLFGTLADRFGNARPPLRQLSQMAETNSSNGSHQEEVKSARPSTTVPSGDRISAILRDRAVDTIFQPIVDLTSAEVVGAEALARFRTESHRAPDSVFREAKTAGLGAELEIMAIQRALERTSERPPGARVR
jgi:hypothetical protein